MLEDISYYYRSPKCYSNKRDAEKEVSYFRKILNENPDSLKRQVFLNKNMEWDYEVLIKDILNGYSISLQKYETRFIVLDVDNNCDNPISFKELRNFLEKKLWISPRFALNTFSSTACHPKFRIFLDFRCSINKDNYKKAATVIAKLINETYPGCVDESKTNLGDIFYGCTDLIYYKKVTAKGFTLAVFLF
jgi:tetratricopeptide (TPR) repeat protein